MTTFIRKKTGFGTISGASEHATAKGQPRDCSLRGGQSSLRCHCFHATILASGVWVFTCLYGVFKYCFFEKEQYIGRRFIPFFHDFFAWDGATQPTIWAYTRMGLLLVLQEGILLECCGLHIARLWWCQRASGFKKSALRAGNGTWNC